jgi:hypothetical protein
LYKRQELVKGYFFYTASLLFWAALIFAIFFKRFDYFVFLLLGFIPVEIFLAPNQIKITDKEISIQKKHLLGFIRSVTIIPFSEIKSVNPIAFDASYIAVEDGMSTTDASLFMPEGSNAPLFTLYQITHDTTSHKTERLKVKLHPNEFDIIQEKLMRLTRTEDNFKKAP